MNDKYNYGTYGYIALRDLQTANILATTAALNSSLFHAQQAIEKILKQYLMIYGDTDNLQDLLRSHKLWRLAVASLISELTDYKATLLRLGDLYFEGRYPGIDYDIPADEESLELIRDANEIFKIVDEKIDVSYLKK